MSKKEKIDLKTPDAFHSTSDRVFAWIERHAQTVGIAVAALVVLSLGWIAYGYFDGRREVAAAEHLFSSESALRRAEATVREQRAKQMTGLVGLDKGKTRGAADSVRPVNFAADFGKIVDEIEAQIKAHAGTRVGLISAMNLSYFLVQEKQFDRALRVLDLVTYRPRASEILGGFWAMHRGLAFIENKKYAEAIRAYREVVETKTLDALHPEALLKLAVAQELDGDVENARQTYEKLSRDYPGTEASSSAGQFLRLLDLKNKKG